MTQPEAAGDAPRRNEGSGGEFVLLGMPDVNGLIRGKALRPPAFKAALAAGTVVTDLLLALDPVDVPITDYDRFGSPRPPGRARL